VQSPYYDLLQTPQTTKNNKTKQKKGMTRTPEWDFFTVLHRSQSPSKIENKTKQKASSHNTVSIHLLDKKTDIINHRS
jgi:hypothetical protein